MTTRWFRRQRYELRVLIRWVRTLPRRDYERKG